MALAVISGPGFAAGDLFDNDYNDCPARTRFRDGQIAGLAVARDAEEANEVNVSWAATDPATWGLGPNTYSTSLVVLLADDDGLHTRTLSLGSRQTTFAGVNTGEEVTVQMAIVVATASGDYLISDILEKSLHQSLTKPAFSTVVKRVTTAFSDDGTPDDTADDTAEVTEDTRGTFYYVGYDENFKNYKKHPDGVGITTRPATPRLRIGLAHGGENNDKRDAVDFDAYIVRITAEDGDVVAEADDVKTTESKYAAGANRLGFGYFTPTTAATPEYLAFSNVRVNDGGTIRASIQAGGPGVGTGEYRPLDITPSGPATGLSFVAPDASTTINSVYAVPPDEHRDLPIDVLASDETYTIAAWAVNEDGDVISPVASLKVRPVDRKVTTGVFFFTDYVGPGRVPFLSVTEFTVLK